MKKILIAGIGTDVGKTVVSAILTTLLEGDYWKPIQCGESDTDVMNTLIDKKKHQIFAPAYHLEAPLSPHQAAKLENRIIDTETIQLPQTHRNLIIESAGGLFVPLTDKIVTFDLFKTWNCQWVVVSKNYLGSINHTLLTLNILQQAHCSILGLIFNGTPNPEGESAILNISQVPLIGRIYPETKINQTTIKRYATEWSKNNLQHLT